MSFLDIKDPEERDVIIADYLAVKKRLKDRILQERNELMNHQQDLEENFKLVVHEQQEDRDIVDELVPITRELRELNNKAPQRPKIASVPRIGAKRDIESQPQSKWKLVTTCGPLTETFLQKYMDSDKKQVNTTLVSDTIMVFQ